MKLSILSVAAFLALLPASVTQAYGPATFDISYTPPQPTSGDRILVTIKAQTTGGCEELHNPAGYVLTGNTIRIDLESVFVPAVPCDPFSTPYETQEDLGSLPVGDYVIEVYVDTLSFRGSAPMTVRPRAVPAVGPLGLGLVSLLLTLGGLVALRRRAA